MKSEPQDDEQQAPEEPSSFIDKSAAIRELAVLEAALPEPQRVRMFCSMNIAIACLLCCILARMKRFLDCVYFEVALASR